MDHKVYVKHDSDNCECCLDFWLGPQPQAREKEILESDADSGYCSITQTKEVTIPSIPIIPRIIVTPLSDEEQIEHNACIRDALIQRNAFTCTITSPSTTSLTSLSKEEKALPSSSSSASRSTVSLATFQSTTSRPSLTPPEESWSHRLKDTYENRMAWPQYFNIPTPHIVSTTVTTTSSSSPSSSSLSIFSTTLAAPHLRKRASKDAIELHPKVLAPVATSRGQSLRKRWSIAGSGVGFGFGTTTSTNPSPTVTPRLTSTVSPRTKADSNPTPPRGARPSRGRPSTATTSPSSKATTATLVPPTSSSDSTSTCTLKRRSRVTSTQSLNDKPSSNASSPSSSTSSLALPSQTGTGMGTGGSPGGTLGRWGRAINSATGGSSGMIGSGNGGGGGGAFGKGMRSLKTLYSNAPSSFRML